MFTLQDIKVLSNAGSWLEVRGLDDFVDTIGCRLVSMVRRRRWWGVMVMLLVLVVIGPAVTMMMGRRIGNRVRVHVDSRWILGCGPGFICLDVCPESVLVCNVVNMTMDPVCILVPIGSLDLVMA